MTQEELDVIINNIRNSLGQDESTSVQEPEVVIDESVEPVQDVEPVQHTHEFTNPVVVWSDNLKEVPEELSPQGEEESEEFINSPEKVLAKQDNPEIPYNPVFSKHEELVRFSSAEWFNKAQEQKVVLAGLGGIGSWVAFLLSKLNPESLVMFDPDIVTEVNLAGQLFSTEDVGKKKVDVVADKIQLYNNYYKVVCYDSYYLYDCVKSDVMICGFDTMIARNDFFRTWKKHVQANPDRADQCLFIDGRLSANELQIFCITGSDKYYMDLYESKYLFRDSEAVQEICSFKQTAYMACMIGSLMTNLFVNFCANLCNLQIPKVLPFLTTYASDFMFFDTTK